MDQSMHNFGWHYGIGFGWTLIAISFILIVFGIVQLRRLRSGNGEAPMPDEPPRNSKKKKKYFELN